MGFNSNLGKQSYIASTGQIKFDFNFKIFTDDDLKVYVTKTGEIPSDVKDIKVLNSDYFVTIDGDDGGYIEFKIGLSVDDTVVILRDLPRIRNTQYVTNGDLFATTINIDQDYQTYLIMDNFVNVLNSIRLPNSATGVNLQLPNVVPDSYLKWNSLGTALENDETLPLTATEIKDILEQILLIEQEIKDSQAATEASASNAENSNLSSIQAATNALASASNAENSNLSSIQAATEALGSASNADASEQIALSASVEAVASANLAKESEVIISNIINTSQINAWKTEADKQTTENYSNTPEDVNVEEVISNDDGTYTIVKTSDYSALHYMEKAKKSAESAAGGGTVLTPEQIDNINDVPNKQDKLSIEQLDNINDVPNKQDKLSIEQLDNINDVPNKAKKDLSNVENISQSFIDQLETAGVGGGGSGTGLPIGSIIPVLTGTSYIPEGLVPCDGTEYTEAQFPDFFQTFLFDQPSLLYTVTYAEYDVQIAATGSCSAFGFDNRTRTFKVPTLADKAVIENALSDSQVGKSFDAGLPNIEGQTNAVRDNVGAVGAFTTISNNNIYSGDSGTSGLSLTFDASLSNPIYGNSTTVQPTAVAIRYFVAIANSTVEASAMDWSRYMDGLAGKADKDLTNTPLDWDYACIINGETTGAENEIQDSNLGVNGLVSVNSRYVLTNPFGINTPVITRLEILVNGKWCDPGWVFTSISHGTNCSFVVGDGIIVRVGNIIITQDTTTGKGNNTFTGNITTPSKCRVHIWKLRRTI